ncbi:MAG: hypothetical protein QOI47_1053 [Actinomycetota bacterium]|nr:hypothetical protein [Actinomycetota bacterium]
MRLVLVDNDASALELIELDLALEGHEIVGTAAQGEEALSVIEAAAPDAVVLDFRMPPGIDGLEVARRAKRRWPELHVLLYSNHMRRDLLDQAEQIGVPYLQKGDLAALRRAILDVVS